MQRDAAARRVSGSRFLLSLLLHPVLRPSLNALSRVCFLAPPCPMTWLSRLMVQRQSTIHSAKLAVPCWNGGEMPTP